MRKIPNAKLRKRALKNAMEALGYPNHLSEKEMIAILKDVYSNDGNNIILSKSREIGWYYGILCLFWGMISKYYGVSLMGTDKDKKLVNRYGNKYMLLGTSIIGLGEFSQKIIKKRLKAKSKSKKKDRKRTAKLLFSAQKHG